VAPAGRGSQSFFATEEILVDVEVAGNCRCFSSSAVDVDGVVGSLMLPVFTR